VVAREEKSLSSAHRWYLRLATSLQIEARMICRRLSADPCAGAHVRSEDPDVVEADDSFVPLARRRPDPLGTALVHFSHQERDLYTFCEESGQPIAGCMTPLVVAFEGQAIEFTPANADRFAFVPGDPASTAWPTAATPWIAIDLDGDGAITSGAELFGDSTALPTGKARNGFEALAALDANHDGVIDAADPAFAKLLLWADRDGNRASSPDELRPLAELIVAIPLAHRVDVRCAARGACEGERGSVHWRDANGRTRVGAVVDVYVSRK
jgi:hypothetical protein